MKWTFLLAVFICNICWAGHWGLHLNLGVYHFKSTADGVPLNNSVPGVGVIYQGENGYLTGGYEPENSFGNESWYGGGGIESYRSRYFGFGFQGVFASGYEDTPARNGGFIGSAVFRIGPEDQALRIHLMGFSGVGFQYQTGF